VGATPHLRHAPCLACLLSPREVCVPPVHGRRVMSLLQRRGLGRSSAALCGHYPFLGLCKSLPRGIQEQQVSPDGICHAKPTSQMGFPDLPRRDEYPRERAFSHPFTSSLPSALRGALPLRPNCGFDPAAVCALHGAAEAGADPKLTQRLEKYV